VYGDFTYGTPAVSKGLVNAMSLTQGVVVGINGRSKILVVGSGNGYELVWLGKKGHDVTGLDLYAPEVSYVKDRTIIGSAEDMPFEDNEFELVFCTEMFEHVSDEASTRILREFQRVAKKFYVTIATIDDPPYYTHVNIQDGWWWIKRFKDLGFNIVNAQVNPYVVLVLGRTFTKVNYANGVTIYGNCRDNKLKT